MDKFAALNAFTTVVEEEGFAPAARRMGTTRSTVNRMVIALEDDWGVQLLNRTTRRVAPTASGKALYERARRLLDDLAETEAGVRDSHSEPVGDLRLNAPMSFGTMHLSPAIADFMALHPNIRVSLTLNDRMVDIVDEGYDLTIRIAEPQEDVDMVDHRIVAIKRVLCASPDYIAAKGAPGHPQDLQTMSCLHYGNLPTGNSWRLGIALLPTFIVGQELQSGRLVTILPDYPPSPLTLCAIYPPSRHLSTKIRLFTDFLIERFGERPYWDLVG